MAFYLEMLLWDSVVIFWPSLFQNPASRVSVAARPGNPVRTSPEALAKKSLIFIHHWMGVALCLLFLLWFSSGIVMMYRDFPSVTAQDRLARSPALDASKIQLSPAEAFAKLDLRQSPAHRDRVSFGRRGSFRHVGPPVVARAAAKVVPCP
jgi:hypothetical protein